VLLLALALGAAATVLGLFQLWPHGERAANAVTSVEFAAPGVTFPHAEVTRIQPPCPTVNLGGEGGQPLEGQTVEPSPGCGEVTARITTETERGKVVRVGVPPQVTDAGLAPGDSIELMRTPSAPDAPSTFSFTGVDRNTPLWILLAMFVVVVGAVARLRGLLALVGLGVGGVVLVKFMLPALLAGESGLAVALVGSAAIMYVVLYLTHGPSLRTSTAVAGTLIGVAITAFIGVVAVNATRLSGISDDDSAFLTGFVGDVSFQGLLTCAIIVAGLGVLNDVTITQSSAVWELRAAAPDLSRTQLFGSAMRIGRDHIASTIYTIVFAYAGAALPVLLLIFIYDRPVLELLSTEDIAAEVVRTLSSAIGLVLAVPVTTAIAALTVAQVRTS